MPEGENGRILERKQKPKEPNGGERCWFWGLRTVFSTDDAPKYISSIFTVHGNHLSSVCPSIEIKTTKLADAIESLNIAIGKNFLEHKTLEA